MIQPMDAASTHDPKDVADNKDLAALGYVWVLSLVVLLARRESPFVQFHARQGAVLFGLSLVVWAAPVVGKLLEVLVLALCVMGFLHAAQGQWKDVPIVGPLSRGSFGDLRSSWRDVVETVSALWSRVRRAGKAAEARAESTPAPTAAPETSSPPPPPESEVPPPAHP